MQIIMNNMNKLINFPNNFNKVLYSIKLLSSSIRLTFIWSVYIVLLHGIC